jgi:hypothetical protein
MSLYNQMPFPPHEGLPWMSGPPTVDGFVEPEYPGFTTTQLDAGYTKCGRVVWGGASGAPNAVFQGIKHNGQDFVYMGFVARYDPTFDVDDYVTIFLRPDPVAGSANDRRIDINPVLASTGAVGGGAPAAPPDANDSAGPPTVHTNKTPPVQTFYKRNPANTGPGDAAHPRWNAGAPMPTGFEAKCRSVTDGTNLFWSVELKVPTTTAAGGASWVNLAKTFGLYVNIGQVTPGVPDEVVTQFPWPYDPNVANSNILHDPLNPVTNPFEQLNWDPDTWGSGILLAPGDVNPALGVRFRHDASGIGIDDGSDIASGTVNTTQGVTNKFVAQLQNTSPNTAPKVRARFRVAEFGISGGLYGNSAAWDDLPDPTTNPAPHTGVDIPTTAAPDGYQKLNFNWTVSAADHAKFAGLGSDQCLWVQLDTAPGTGSSAVFVEDSVRRNLWFVSLSTTTHTAVVDPKHLQVKNLIGGNHSLILHVASSPVKLTQQTPLERVYKAGGIAFEALPGLTAARRTALESVAAERMSPLLMENPITTGTIARLPIDPGDGPRIPPTRIATWHSVVNAYELVPGRHLTFKGGKRRRIAVYAGAYGYIGRHVLQRGESVENLQLTHTISAPGMTKIGINTYALTLNPATKLQLKNQLTAAPIAKARTVARPVQILLKPIAAIRNIFSRFTPGR